MSITSIRQRKLFKSTHNKNFLLKLLSNDPQSDRQDAHPLKTQQSQPRQSYSSSRPTLQESHITKQVSALQNKVNKQQAMTDRCFEEMQCLQNHYEILKQKLCQKYQMKLKLVRDRIKKQCQRNVKARNKMMENVGKIVEKVEKQNMEMGNKIGGKGSASDGVSSQQVAIQLLEMIKFERTHRQLKNISLPQQQSEQINLGKAMDCSHAEQTLVLEVKPSAEDRQSQSILLDDSYIN